MSLVRRIARPMLAATFVVQGLDALRHPAPLAEHSSPLLDKLVPMLGLPDDKVNVNGGAIALGHPVGMSGARLVLHLALELQRRGGGVGAAALCGGGGLGDALVVHVPAG